MDKYYPLYKKHGKLFTFKLKLIRAFWNIKFYIRSPFYFIIDGGWVILLGILALAAAIFGLYQLIIAEPIVKLEMVLGIFIIVRIIMIPIRVFKPVIEKIDIKNSETFSDIGVKGIVFVALSTIIVFLAYANFFLVTLCLFFMPWYISIAFAINVAANVTEYFIKKKDIKIPALKYVMIISNTILYSSFVIKLALLLNWI